MVSDRTRCAFCESEILDETICETVSDTTGNKYTPDHAQYCKVVDPGEEKKERACDSLIMCIVTTLNQGLRNGGGIGDILRAPSSEVRSSTCLQ